MLIYLDTSLAHYTCMKRVSVVECMNVHDVAVNLLEGSWTVCDTLISIYSVCVCVSRDEQRQLSQSVIHSDTPKLTVSSLMTNMQSSQQRYR